MGPGRAHGGDRERYCTVRQDKGMYDFVCTAGRTPTHYHADDALQRCARRLHDPVSTIPRGYHHVFQPCFRGQHWHSNAVRYCTPRLPPSDPQRRSPARLRQRSSRASDDTPRGSHTRRPLREGNNAPSPHKRASRPHFEGPFLSHTHPALHPSFRPGLPREATGKRPRRILPDERLRYEIEIRPRKRI